LFLHTGDYAITKIARNEHNSKGDAKKLKPPAAYITQDKQGKLNPIILQRYFVYYISLVLDIFDVLSTV